MELLGKRAELVQKIEELQDRIGFRQGQHIDADMHLRYLEMYKNEDESPTKKQRTEENSDKKDGEEEEKDDQLDLRVPISTTQQEK